MVRLITRGGLPPSFKLIASLEDGSHRLVELLDDPSRTECQCSTLKGDWTTQLLGSVGLFITPLAIEHHFDDGRVFRDVLMATVQAAQDSAEVLAAVE